MSALPRTIALDCCIWSAEVGGAIVSSVTPGFNRAG